MSPSGLTSPHSKMPLHRQTRGLGMTSWPRAEPVKSRLHRLGRAHRSELVRLLPELVSDDVGLSPPETRPEMEQRQRLFDALVIALQAVGEPLLLIADDLQWWDRDSLQFLHYLLRVQPEARQRPDCRTL